MAGNRVAAMLRHWLPISRQSARKYCLERTLDPSNPYQATSEMLGITNAGDAESVARRDSFMAEQETNSHAQPMRQSAMLQALPQTQRGKAVSGRDRPFGQTRRSDGASVCSCAATAARGGALL